MFQIKGHQLYIDGCKGEDLAEQYGTPCMVISEDQIRTKCRELKSQFLDRYENVRAAYAGKAFLPMAMCQLINEEGLGLDVVSGGELYTALEAGFPPERMEFNGNNKSSDEIRMAVENGVGRLIIDGMDELELIESVCQEANRKIKALLRISPGVDSHTHQFISTGNVDSKFGMPLHGDHLDHVLRGIMKSQWVELLGFHFHIGSQLHDNTSHLQALDTLLNLIEDVHTRYGLVTTEINVGGGFGIRYTEEDDAKPYSYFLDPIMEHLHAHFQQSPMACPTLVIEPGRSLVANAGCTLYRVGAVKEIPGVRKYVSVDGGMTDNIRTALYDSKYECFVNATSQIKETVTIAGKCCESGDILIHDAVINAPKRGDLLTIFSTGAYCLPMASNYNKIPFLPVVFTRQGESRLVVRRQTYDELADRERIGLK